MLPYPERFWAKADTAGECWIWTGALLKGGYGYSWDPTQQRVRLTHRVAYELVKGLIPDGLVIDHLCRNRACINPDHLEAVSQSVNILRGDLARTIRASRAAQTHCRREGHPLSDDNLRVDKRGRRSCRECQRVGDRERKRAKRLAAV